MREAKVACLIPVRDKAYFVSHTIQSTLAQTRPCEILISDQGSIDDSLTICQSMAAFYTGPHRVRVVSCPHTAERGIAGLNAHLDWMIGQTDAELLIVVSADDLCHPDRVARTVETYDRHRPAYIGTKMQFLRPPTEGGKLEIEGLTAFDPHGSRWITAREHIECLVGGSVSTAFDRKFYETIGGLRGHVIPDVYLPFLATFDRGFWMIDEQLFGHVRHARADNAGLGGRLLKASGDNDETLLLNELANYQTVSTLYKAGRVAARIYPEAWSSDAGVDGVGALYQNIVNRTNDWAVCRDLLNERRLQPRLL